MKFGAQSLVQETFSASVVKPSSVDIHGKCLAEIEKEHVLRLQHASMITTCNRLERGTAPDAQKVN